MFSKATRAVMILVVEAGVSFLSAFFDTMTISVSRFTMYTPSLCSANLGVKAAETLTDGNNVLHSKIIDINTEKIFTFRI